MREEYSLGEREAFLLGLAMALTNHVLFILLIAEILIGPNAILPIVALISMDGMLIFSGTIVMMDIMSSKEQGWRSCLAPYIRSLIFGFSTRVSGVGGRMFNA